MINHYAIQAEILAKYFHKDQVDIGGTDYFSGHITNVVKQLKKTTDDDNIITVAFLHDILEDTEVNEEDLLGNFPTEIVEAVIAITKNDESYDNYLKRVKSNNLARIVKLADLQDNSDLSRLNRPQKTRDYIRLEKYNNAIKYLSDEKGDY